MDVKIIWVLCKFWKKKIEKKKLFFECRSLDYKSKSFSKLSLFWGKKKGLFIAIYMLVASMKFSRG